MSIYKTIAVADASEDSDVKRATLMSMVTPLWVKCSSSVLKVRKSLLRLLLMRPEYAEAHDDGDIHIHDLDFYATGTLTCCQTDPLRLFEDGGFNTGQVHSVLQIVSVATVLLRLSFSKLTKTNNMVVRVSQTLITQWHQALIKLP